MDEVVVNKSFVVLLCTEPPLQVQATGQGEGNERERTHLAKRFHFTNFGFDHCKQLFCEYRRVLLWCFLATQDRSSGAHQGQQADHVSFCQSCAPGVLRCWLCLRCFYAKSSFDCKE